MRPGWKFLRNQPRRSMGATPGRSTRMACTGAGGAAPGGLGQALEAAVWGIQRDRALRPEDVDPGSQLFKYMPLDFFDHALADDGDVARSAHQSQPLPGQLSR